MTDKTDGLLAQHHLLLSIIHTEWATRLDHKVAAVIIERYFGKFGNARVSLRYLADRTKATRPNIIASVRRLTARGAFTVLREGAGTRPTEYALNFGFSASGIVDDTSPRGIAGDTSCGIADDTSRPSSGIVDDTKTYLHVPAYNAGLHEGRKFEAAPSAPPADGLTATAAGPASGAGEEFSSFWAVWPRKHGKKKCEAEWKRIDASLRGTVIAVAGAWAAHYTAHGVDKKWIPEPANWLKGERWDEDLPLIHIDAKGAAIAKAKANAPSKPEPSNDNEPANDDIPDWMRGSPQLWPLGKYYGEFVEGDVRYEGGDKMVTLQFMVNQPGPHFAKTFEHKFPIESFSQSAQDEGQATVRNIMSALRMGSLDDTDEILFKPLVVTADGATLKYLNISEAA
jgi:hypothetical protein